jgi:hypothetical protein
MDKIKRKEIEDLLQQHIKLVMYVQYCMFLKTLVINNGFLLNNIVLIYILRDHSLFIPYSRVGWEILMSYTKIL